jgi:hypothetical protein
MLDTGWARMGNGFTTLLAHNGIKNRHHTTKWQARKGVIGVWLSLPPSQRLLLAHRFVVFLSIGLTTAGGRRII